MSKDKIKKENGNLPIFDVSNCLSDEVEVRALYDIPSLKKYGKWTKETRFLALGLCGIEMREIK